MINVVDEYTNLVLNQFNFYGKEIMEKYDDFFRGLAKKCFKFKI